MTLGFPAAAPALRVMLAMLSAIATAAVSAQQTKSQWDGIYSEAQAKRGDSLYAENCLACHGANLAGGERAPALTGDAFVGRWNDRSLGDLFDYMSVMMPMQSPGGLNRQQNADILAFILNKGTFPTGQMDLPAQTDALNQYKFLAMKR